MNKFLVNLCCAFIAKKKNRHHFRKKYKDLSVFESVFFSKHTLNKLSNLDSFGDKQQILGEIASIKDSLNRLFDNKQKGQWHILSYLQKVEKMLTSVSINKTVNYRRQITNNKVLYGANDYIADIFRKKKGIITTEPLIEEVDNGIIYSPLNSYSPYLVFSENREPILLSDIESCGKCLLNTLLKIKKMFDKDNTKVEAIGRARESVSRVLTEFKQKPLLSIAEITKRTKLSRPTAISSVGRLIDIGIVKNISKKKWGQIYSYEGYTKLLTSNEE
jgi:hypothetical protein